ncbi:MAG: hypothetical protein AB1798_07350, partial [Spirochaetota bacterium]
IKNIALGNQAAAETAKSLEEIVSGAGKAADFLGEIALASKEQAQAIDQITAGLDQIDQVTQANTASAEESASSAEELSGQGQQLKAMLARFKLEKRAAGFERERDELEESRHRLLEHPEARKRMMPAEKPQKPPVRTVQDTAKKIVTPARKEETGIKPVNPAEVIKLDDDDFDRF